MLTRFRVLDVGALCSPSEATSVELCLAWTVGGEDFVANDGEVAWSRAENARDAAATRPVLLASALWMADPVAICGD